MRVITLGPWLLPVGILAIVLGWFAAWAVAAILRRRGQADSAPALWWLLLIALLAGRAAYVIRWWPAYRASAWWNIFDIRDRGFEPWAAGIVLVLSVLLVAWRRPRLRRPLPLATAGGLAVAVLTLVVAWQLQTAAHPRLPNVELRQLDGQSVNLTALAGEPLVINLWATWCPPCRRELPMLLRASHDMPGVRFVFVDQGESAATVWAFLQKQGQMAPEYLLLDAAGDLARAYRAPGYPATLFIDADGRLRDLYIGPLSRATLTVHLQSLRPALAGRKSST